MSDEVKHWLDWAAISTTVATIAGWLPSIAALFGVIWTAIRIWESETVKYWTGRNEK